MNQLLVSPLFNHMLLYEPPSCFFFFWVAVRSAHPFIVVDGHDSASLLSLSIADRAHCIWNNQKEKRKREREVEREREREVERERERGRERERFRHELRNQPVSFLLSNKQQQKTDFLCQDAKGFASPSWYLSCFPCPRWALACLQQLLATRCALLRVLFIQCFCPLSLVIGLCSCHQ